LKNILLWIVLWLLPVVFAIGGGVFLHFDAKRGQQARIDAANTEVREAVKEADGWIKQGSAKDGENVEQRLMKAIAAKDVSEEANADPLFEMVRWIQPGSAKNGENVERGLRKAIVAKDVSEEVNADAVLELVRTRRTELAADSLFDSAKTKLDAKEFVEAVELLQQYVADPHATKKPEAQQLLADCELATSESAAINTLVAMSDERFVQFENTGKLDDTGITHPVLVEIRVTTLRRNLETASQRREENKIAEENRQESERLAVEDARRAKAAKETELYVKQQIGELWAGEFWRPPPRGDLAYRAFDERRHRAVDNLKALGPAALAAVPELDNVVISQTDSYMTLKAIEALGEIGARQGLVAVTRKIAVPGRVFRTEEESEIAKAAEDSFLKLLPAFCSDLTMDDAIFLLEVHRLGNQRVLPAIESAWAASGITQDAMAKEINRRALEAQALAEAKADSESRVPDGWNVISTTIGDYYLQKDTVPFRPEIGQSGVLKRVPNGWKIITDLDGSPKLTRKSPGEPGYETDSMKNQRDYEYYAARRRADSMNRPVPPVPRKPINPLGSVYDKPAPRGRYANGVPRE